MQGLEPDMLQYMQNLTPEQLQALTRDYQGEQGALDRQLSQGNALRETPAPQGMQVGQQYFASNPLEQLGSLGSKAIGAYQGNQAEQGIKDLGMAQQGATGDLMAALIANKQAAAAQTMPRTFDQSLMSEIQNQTPQKSYF